MLERITHLAERLRALPGTRTEVTTFSSGNVWLDVWRGRRLFILEWGASNKRFGVDEVVEDEGFMVGFRHLFDDLDEAEACLTRLLAGAGTNGAGHTPVQQPSEAS